MAAAGTGSWPATPDALRESQAALAARNTSRERRTVRARVVAGCYVCFERDHAGLGAAGEPAWAAAALLRGHKTLDTATLVGTAGWSYEPGLLALREGPILAGVVGLLPRRPDVVLVNATGLDHPLRCGLAVHLGAVLDLPTVGVTDRTLVAAGEQPGSQRGARTPLRLDGEVVGYWLRSRAGARPIAVHGGWHTDADEAAEVVEHALLRARTPQALRVARRAARELRAASSG